MGRSVEVYGSDYLLNTADQLLGEYDFEILPKEAYEKHEKHEKHEKPMTLWKDIYLVDMEGDDKGLADYFKLLSEYSKVLFLDTK